MEIVRMMACWGVKFQGQCQTSSRPWTIACLCLPRIKFMMILNQWVNSIVSPGRAVNVDNPKHCQHCYEPMNEPLVMNIFSLSMKPSSLQLTLIPHHTQGAIDHLIHNNTCHYIPGSQKQLPFRLHNLYLLIDLRCPAVDPWCGRIAGTCFAL